MELDESELPKPAEELEELASYYDEHDTAEEMGAGHWIEPMVTTSLRLPRELFDELKATAQREGKRHTVFIRELLERSLREQAGAPAELSEIRAQLDRVLKAVEAGPRQPDERSDPAQDSRASAAAKTGK